MIDVDQARDKIKDILDAREYQDYYGENRNFLQRFWDSVMEWLNELLVKLFGSLEPSNGFATGLVVILGIIVLVLVIIAVFFVVRYFKRKSRFQEQSHFFNQQEKDWTSLEHLSKANELENNGNLPLATRHLFLALLLYFHEKGYIEARIWKTNWEYFEELKRYEKKRAESFNKLARIFEDVVYGEQTVEKESYLAYKESVLHWIQEPPEERTVEGQGGR
jgi:hypothetical protein